MNLNEVVCLWVILSLFYAHCCAGVEDELLEKITKKIKKKKNLQRVFLNSKKLCAGNVVSALNSRVQVLVIVCRMGVVSWQKDKLEAIDG